MIGAIAIAVVLLGSIVYDMLKKPISTKRVVRKVVKRAAVKKAAVKKKRK
jgi:hypothetical protein